jgi:hypothetical protein
MLLVRFDGGYSSAAWAVTAMRLARLAVTRTALNFTTHLPEVALAWMLRGSARETCNEAYAAMAIMKAIAKDAWSRGELVYAYQQGDEDYNYKDIGPWGAVRNGYCAALGFKWIGLRLRGQDLEYDAKTRFATKEDWRITRLHNLTKDANGYNNVLTELGLERQAPTSFLGIPSALQVVPKVALEQGCYMLQYRRDGGGHLVAIQVEEKGFRYFDANYGHFVFTTKDRFTTWYQDFLSVSRYRERYTNSTIVTKVVLYSGSSVGGLRARFGG